MIDRASLKNLVIPMGPVKRIVKAMFEKPMELDAEIAQMNKFLNGLDDLDPSAANREGAAKIGSREVARVDGPGVVSLCLASLASTSPSQMRG